jgi:hypothetical protein
MQINKQQLLYFDFQDFNKPKAEITREDLAPVRTNSMWLLRQMLTFLGHTFRLVKNEEGKYSPTFSLAATNKLIEDGTLMYEGVPVPKEVLYGMIKILTHYPRTDILNARMMKQSGPGGSRYNAGVPLVLSAFKEIRNIPYSDWDWEDENMQWLVDSGIYELVPYFGKEQPWTPSQLIEIREQANTKGVNVVNLYSITVCKDKEFKELPRLLKLMLTQVWVYHPSLRHNLMISNHMDLDNFPESLIASDIEESKEKIITLGKKEVKWGSSLIPTVKKKSLEDYLSGDIPWDDV